MQPAVYVQILGWCWKNTLQRIKYWNVGEVSDPKFISKKSLYKDWNQIVIEQRIFERKKKPFNSTQIILGSMGYFFMLQKEQCVQYISATLFAIHIL